MRFRDLTWDRQMTDRSGDHFIRLLQVCKPKNNSVKTVPIIDKWFIFRNPSQPWQDRLNKTLKLKAAVLPVHHHFHFVPRCHLKNSCIQTCYHIFFHSETVSSGEPGSDSSPEFSPFIWSITEPLGTIKMSFAVLPLTQPWVTKYWR